MKIGQKPEIPTAAVQTGLAKQAKDATGASETAAKSVSASLAAGVPVTVSNAARAMESRVTTDFDAGRVQAVKSAIEKGTFTVDAEAIADKLLSNVHEIFSRARG